MNRLTNSTAVGDRQQTSTTHPRGNAAVGVAVAGLAAILPLVFFGQPADPTLAASGLWLVNAVLLIWASVRLGMILGSGEIRLLITMYWLFVYIAMAVVPMAQLHVGVWGRLADASYLLSAQAMALIASLAIDIGYGLRGSSKPSDELAVSKTAWDRVVTLGRLRVLTLISFPATGLYVYTAGSISVFFDSRFEQAAAIRTAELGEGLAVSSIVGALGTIPIFISFLLWFLLLIQRPDFRRNVEPWFWIIICVSVNVIVNNPITNPRFWILTMILGVCFSLPKLNINRFRLIIVGGIIFALVAFPYSDYFRTSVQDRQPLTVGSIAETIATKDFDQSPMTANGVWWVDGVGHSFGQQALGAVLFFIPRSVWPDKPIDTGVAIGTAMQASNTNLSSPLWLEVWVDFSWPGLVISFIILGIIMRQGDNIFSKLRVRALSTHVHAIYLGNFMLPLIAGYSLIVLRGPLLQSMSRLAVLIIVCWLVTKTLKDTASGRRRSASSGRLGIKPLDKSRVADHLGE